MQVNIIHLGLPEVCSQPIWCLELVERATGVQIVFFFFLLINFRLEEQNLR